MPNLLISTFSLSIIMVFLNVSAARAAISCDLDGAVAKAAKTDIVAQDAKKFKTNYDLGYRSQENAIQAFGKARGLNAEKAREQYFQTDAGKKTIAQLIASRGTFSYDSASAYLFDDTRFNRDPKFYTHVLNQGDKRYYLDGQQVIATLQKRANDTHLLTRFDSYCNIKEILRFETLEEESDAPVSFKVNSAFCQKFVSDRKLELSEKQQDELDVALFAPEENAAEWSTDLLTTCRLFSPTSNAPKSGSPRR